MTLIFWLLSACRGDRRCDKWKSVHHVTASGMVIEWPSTLSHRFIELQPTLCGHPILSEVELFDITVVQHHINHAIDPLIGDEIARPVHLP